MPLVPLRLTGLLLLGALTGCAGSRTAVVPAPAEADPTALVPWAGGVAVAAGAEVRWVRGRAVAATVAVPAPVLALGADGGALWLGTPAGVFTIASPSAPPEPVALPGLDRPPHVLDVHAEGGRVWVSTLYDGTFARGADGAWSVVSRTAPASGVVVHPGALWIGTHQGVHREADDGGTQFIEEGTTDHGLLDNIVDRLIGTADGTVWAVHPEGVSVFTDGEPHGFRFVGRAGTALHDVAALPGGGFVLATSDGVLAVPALSNRPEGFYEVYADSGADALPVAGLVPAALGGAPPTRVAVDGRTVWFASRAGVWSVPADAFRPALAAR